jgi:small-conductance mechanosensitive channel
MKEVFKCAVFALLFLIVIAAIFGSLGLIVWGILSWLGPIGLVYFLGVIIYVDMCYYIHFEKLRS